MARHRTICLLRTHGLTVATIAVSLAFFANAGARSDSKESNPVLLALMSSVSTAPRTRGNNPCLASVRDSWIGLTLETLGTNRASQVGKARKEVAIGSGSTSTYRSREVKSSGIKLCTAPIKKDDTSTAIAFATGNGTAPGNSLAADPNYVTWYDTPSPWPSPITSAYVGIGGALGAANIYNSGTSPYDPMQSPGTGALGTGVCYFICFGAPGTKSHHYLSYGNDVNPTGSNKSYTHDGAADDCNFFATPVPYYFCPGGIANQIFAVTVQATPLPPAANGNFLAIDGAGNMGLLGNLYSGESIVAGAGVGSPAPIPPRIIGSLVSFVGISPARGELLLGSNADAAKCDFGETTSLALSCNQTFVVSAGGIQTNSATAGYIPEAFPGSLPGLHPRILSATCSVSSSTVCTFPNSFTFHDVFYNCTVSAQGSTPVSAGYSRTSATTITITSSSASTLTFSYICMR